MAPLELELSAEQTEELGRRQDMLAAFLEARGLRGALASIWRACRARVQLGRL